MTTMQTAYQLAALAVRQRLAEQQPQALEILNSLQSGDVAAYEGSFDQAEEALKCLDIPVIVNPQPAALMKTSIAFVNCSNSYNKKMLQAIGGYVEAGRQLVTSDWALHYVLEPAFPAMVRWNRRRTGDEIISVEPDIDSLWSDIVVLGADPQWWLWGSYPIEVLNQEHVRIEAASHDLLVHYKTPVVAVSFAWGAGHVFHVISHFWAKRSDAPSARHSKSYPDFLKAGMRLSQAGIERIIKDSGVAPDAVNFAMLQSAATATELIAQLCIRAKRAVNSEQ